MHSGSSLLGILLFLINVAVVFHHPIPPGGAQQEASTSREADLRTERALLAALGRVRARLSTPRPLRPRDQNSDVNSQELINLAQQLSTSQNMSEYDQADDVPSEIDDEEMDETYCPEEVRISSERTVSLATMKIILDLHAKRRSEHQIQKQYRWYRRQYLKTFRDCIARGGIRKSEALTSMSDTVAGIFRESRDKGYPVRGHDIRSWARVEGKKVGLRNFVASATWLANFKKRYNVKSRKVTKVVSQNFRANAAEDMKKADEFRKDYSERLSYFFRHKFIWNVDQVGFNYEQSTDRTLSNKGERDTVLVAGTRNKRTHSYTTQPMISRSGHVIGKLAIILQEPKGSFGPRVAEKVQALENDYGNIVAFASKSGKMDSDLTERWVESVLIPAMNYSEALIGPDDQLHEDQGAERQPGNLLRSENRGVDQEDEQCYQKAVSQSTNCDALYWPDSSYCHADAAKQARNDCLSPPHRLLLMDSWAGNRPITRLGRMRSIKTLTVPERTTGQLQPLDVGFMRQYKIFVNRITNQAHYHDLIKDVTSREGILNMHSLIWNQFSAPAYTSMIRNCWNKTDLNFDDGEVEDPLPKVREIQFAFKDTECSVRDCENHAFIRCAHCGKVLCLHHFLERNCFHDPLSPLENHLNLTESAMVVADVDEEFDEELLYDMNEEKDVPESSNDDDSE